MASIAPRILCALLPCLAASADIVHGQGRFSNNPLVRPLTIPSLQSGLAPAAAGTTNQAAGNRGSATANNQSGGFVGRSTRGFVGRSTSESNTPSAATSSGSGRASDLQGRALSAARSLPNQQPSNPSVASPIALRWRTAWQPVPRKSQLVRANLLKLQRSFEQRYRTKIRLELDQNGVVVMRGKVNQHREQYVAEILVRMEPGVKGVQNLLQVAATKQEGGAASSR